MQTIELNIREKCKAELADTRARLAAQEEERKAELLKRNSANFAKLLGRLGVTIPEGTVLNPTEDLLLDGLRLRMLQGDQSEYSHYVNQRIALVGTCAKCQNDVLYEANCNYQHPLAQAIEELEQGAHPWHTCPEPEGAEAPRTLVRRPTVEERYVSALVDLLLHYGFQTEE